jgi:nucleoside-diphosphate-sugar epimerase
MSSKVPAANPLAEDLDHVLAHTAEVWEEIRSRRIFVTGGTGFFGRWLLESFVAANARFGLNAQIVVLSRQPAAFRAAAPHLSREAGVEFVTADVRNFTAQDVAAQLDEGAARFDFIVHAATESNSLLNVQNPVLMLDTVVQGTRAALEFAVAAQARRFLFTSSGAVYGAQPHSIDRIPEDYVGGPDLTSAASAYAEGKRAAEVLCACYAQTGELQPVIARCFAFFGPHLPLDTHLATANFIRDAFGGGPIRVSGSGADVRSFLYAADLTVALWTILAHGKPGRPYNVGSEQAVTIAQWAREIGAVIAPRAEVQVAQPDRQSADASRYVPDTRRSQEELGLRERIPRAEGLCRFLRWRDRQERLSAGAL